MSETIEDLRNENFRLKLRKGSHWLTNQQHFCLMITFLRIYHLEMDKVQTEKVIQSYKSELRKRSRNVWLRLWPSNFEQFYCPFLPFIQTVHFHFKNSETGVDFIKKWQDRTFKWSSWSHRSASSISKWKQITDTKYGTYRATSKSDWIERS